MNSTTNKYNERHEFADRKGEYDFKFVDEKILLWVTTCKRKSPARGATQGFYVCTSSLATRREK